MEVWPQYLPAPDIPSGSAIQEVFRTLANDTERTRRISRDVIVAYREGRKILVLTERIEHLEFLREALGEDIEHCFVLHGRLSRKTRADILGKLDALNGVAPACVLLSPGRLIGEGFDHPSLNTLMLAMPISSMHEINPSDTCYRKSDRRERMDLGKTSTDRRLCGF